MNRKILFFILAAFMLLMAGCAHYAASGTGYDRYHPYYPYSYPNGYYYDGNLEQRFREHHEFGEQPEFRGHHEFGENPGFGEHHVFREHREFGAPYGEFEHPVDRDFDRRG
jgi:hypothetical protein